MRINRRRLVQGLLLAGPAFGAQAAAGLRLEFGLADAPGTGSHALGQQTARQLARRLRTQPGDRTAVAVTDLLPAADATSWCAAAPGVSRVVLATIWRSGLAADASCTAVATPASALGLRPLGALARSPLVLMASRCAPTGWPAVRSAAQASATPWRCGIDGSDQPARDACALLLSALGLERAETLPFRGPAQLLPALVGDRMPLAVQTVGQYMGQSVGRSVGERWQALSADEAAGNLGDATAAHRRGDVQLLAVADRIRLPALPEVPTLDELRGCAGNDIGRCLLLLAPADLDAGVAAWLVEALTAGRQLTTS